MSKEEAETIDRPVDPMHRWSYTQRQDGKFVYVGGPVSNINAACPIHANVEIGQTESGAGWLKIVKDVKSGDELCANYSAGSVPVVSGRDMICGWNGCQTYVTIESANYSKPKRILKRKAGGK